MSAPEFPDFGEMTERERAEWMQAHKDDPGFWGEPIKGRRVRARALDVMLSLRLTADQVAHVRRGAQRRGMSLSAFMRSAAIEAANDQQPNGSSAWGSSIVKFKASA